MDEKLLTAMLVPLIGIILIGVVWSSVQDSTTTTTVTNESFSGVNNTYVALTYDDWASSSAVRNGTGTELNSSTDYDVNLTSGSIKLLNQSNGTYYADYTYYPDGYIEGSMSRTILNYLPIMFAIALFVFLAGYVALKGRQ